MISVRMAAPVVLTLQARTPFKAGDVGWVTEDGAICTEGRPEVRLDGCIRVRAIEPIAALTRGRFIEVGPPPDAPDVSYLFE